MRNLNQGKPNPWNRIVGTKNLNKNKMKKLFFTALVAVAAVGGAYAQYTSTPFGPSEFNCQEIDTPTCGQVIPGTIYEAGTNNEALVYDLQFSM